MSALSYARKQRTQTAQPVMSPVMSPTEEISQVPVEKIQKSQKKSFTHSNNVIIKRGVYSGYYGFVKDFHPAKYEVEIDEQEYISKNRLVYYPNAMILSSIPELYQIKTEKGNIRMPKEALVKIVIYKDDNGVMNLAQVMQEGQQCELALIEMEDEFITGFSKLNISSDLFTVEESSDDQQKNIQKLLKNLKNKIRKNKNIEKNITVTCDKSKIVSPEYYFVLNKSSNPNDPDYQGEYGVLEMVIDEQVLIKNPKKMFLAKDDIRKINPDQSVVLRKEYSDKLGNAITRGRLIQKHPTSLTLYIEANGRTITGHYIKSNGEFVHRPITPNDVFYMDILLKNGNVFQVNKISDDDTMITGIERVNNKFVDRMIANNDNDIASFQPGFSFSKQVIKLYPEVEYVSEETQEAEPEVDEIEEEEYVESDEIPEESEEVQEGEEEMQKFAKTFEQGPEMVSTFKDAERTYISRPQMTSAQKDIRLKINKILSIYNVDIDEYYLIKKVESLIEQIQEDLKNANVMFWRNNDVKFIIACAVLHEIIQRGLISYVVSAKQDVITKYVSDLSQREKFTFEESFFGKQGEKELLSRAQQFLVNVDVQNSIFLRSDWTKLYTVDNNMVEKLIKEKNLPELFKIIINNCMEIVQHHYGRIDLNPEDFPPIIREADLIPIGKSKYIYPEDLLDGKIPETATAIYWNKNYKNLLETYKKSLQAKVDSSKTETNKNIYKYVIDNIERAPFALLESEKLQKTLADKQLQFEVLKYNTLKTVYDQLLKQIKKIVDQSVKDKNIQYRTMLKEGSEKQKESKRKREAYIEKSRKKMDSSDSDSMEE